MSQTKAQLIDAVDGSIVTADIADGAINNAKINASAAIAKTKIETFVNNNGTTRIITGTDNVNELDAESNLTVNGSTITFAESTLTVSKGTLATVSAKETAGNKEIALRANTTGGVLRTIGNYPLIFEIAQAEKIRLDTSGRLLIGHSTSLPAASGSSQFSLQVLGTSFATSTLNSQRYADDAAGASILLNKSRGGLGNHTIVQNDDQLGKIRFYGSDGNDFDNYGAEIAVHVDAAPGDNAMPGRFVFSTTTTGSPTPSERMRIDSQGRVKIAGVGATISNHSAAVTQTPLYIQTVTNETAVNTSEGSTSTGLFRMYDVSTNSDRYHGIELRNKSNGDIRILNQDRNTSDKGDLVIAMPKSDGLASGCSEKIRISGLFDSVNIAGKGGATLLGPSDSGYNKQKTDVYIATKTEVTAVNTQAGDAVAGIIRFEDVGSNNNRFHGLELRNKNSGDIRILNKDVGVGNKAHMVFAIDNGSDVTEVARFLDSGGLTFNGDTSTNNALDDYEEGTWIPTVTYSNGGGATLIEQKGFYVKIGRQVHCQCAVSASAKGGGSGNMRINGLPFTSSSTDGTRHNGVMPYIAQFNSILSQVLLYNAGATTSIEAYQLNSSSGSGSAIANVTRNNLNDTFAFRCHLRT